MEGNINAFERDRSKASLKVDRLRFSFGLLGAFADNLDELSLDFFQ